MTWPSVGDGVSLGRDERVVVAGELVGVTYTLSAFTRAQFMGRGKLDTLRQHPPPLTADQIRTGPTLRNPGNRHVNVGSDSLEPSPAWLSPRGGQLAFAVAARSVRMARICNDLRLGRSLAARPVVGKRLTESKQTVTFGTLGRGILSTPPKMNLSIRRSEGAERTALGAAGSGSRCDYRAGRSDTTLMTMAS